MKRVKPRTPQGTAQHMTQAYGRDAVTHATYNLMQYDRGTPGYDYWLAVLDHIRGTNIPKEALCAHR